MVAAGHISLGATVTLVMYVSSGLCNIYDKCQSLVYIYYCSKFISSVCRACLRMVRCKDPVFCPFVRLSINICDHPSQPYQVYLTLAVTVVVMKTFMCFTFEVFSVATVSFHDLDLPFTVHDLVQLDE